MLSTWGTSTGFNAGFFAALQTSVNANSSGGSATGTFTRASTAYVPGYTSNGVVTDPPTALLLASDEAGFWGARRVSQGVWSTTDANGVPLILANGANSGLCDAGGNFGYFSGGARADVLGTTNAIRRTMSDAGWVISGAGTGITVTTSTGFDGGVNACARLTCNTNGATILFTPGLAGAERTYSAWLKRITGVGAVSLTGDGTNFTAQTFGTNFSALPNQIDAGSVVPIVGIKMATAGDVIDVDFNTLEAATFANPTPIPVNVSKAVDALTYLLAGNASRTVGSSYVERYFLTTPTGNDRAMGDSSGNFFSYVNGTPKAGIFDGTNNVVTAATISANSLIKQATYWNAATSGMGVVFNGGTVATGTFVGTFAIGPITIGGSGNASSTIRNFRSYPAALSAAQLQAMTGN